MLIKKPVDLNSLSDNMLDKQTCLAESDKA